MPPDEIGEGHIAAYVFVGVIVEVVLDGDAVELLIGVRRAGVDEEADLVVEPVNVHELALDVGVLLPGRHLGRAPAAPQMRPIAPVGRCPSGSAAELVGPAHRLTLHIRHEPDHVAEVQRHVQLVVGVKPARRECSRRIRDRVERQERKEIGIIHHHVGMDRGVVHARMGVVGEKVSKNESPRR